jgi:hypothetical protein
LVAAPVTDDQVIDLFEAGNEPLPNAAFQNRRRIRTRVKK